MTYIVELVPYARITLVEASEIRKFLAFFWSKKIVFTCVIGMDRQASSDLSSEFGTELPRVMQQTPDWFMWNRRTLDICIHLYCLFGFMMLHIWWGPVVLTISWNGWDKKTQFLAVATIKNLKSRFVTDWTTQAPEFATIAGFKSFKQIQYFYWVFQNIFCLPCSRDCIRLLIMCWQIIWCSFP